MTARYVHLSTTGKQFQQVRSTYIVQVMTARYVHLSTTGKQFQQVDHATSTKLTSQLYEQGRSYI